MYRVKMCLITVLVGILAFYFTGMLQNEVERFPDKSKTGILLSYSTELPISFAVLGDIHCNTYKFERALKDLHNINPAEDALVLNGDTVDQGLDKQYSRFLASIDKNKALLPAMLIINIGNHEYFDYSKGLNSPSMIDGYISKYLTFSSNKKVYHDTWLKGYHFISLGSEQCNTRELGNTQAFISEAQQIWLKEKLAENYKPGRPIFVFLHQNLSGNTKEEDLKKTNVRQDHKIKAILSKYPEAVIFTSHTHNFLTGDNMLYIKEPFAAIHTGSVNNPLIQDVNGKKFDPDKSQGLYVEAEKGKITVRGRNFDSSTWVQGATYSKNFNVRHKSPSS